MKGPQCHECSVEMERYEQSPDTGRGGWRCSDCGWSEDNNETGFRPEVPRVGTAKARKKGQVMAKPNRMKPWRGWCYVWPSGKRSDTYGIMQQTPKSPFFSCRIARVEVREVVKKRRAKR